MDVDKESQPTAALILIDADSDSNFINYPDLKKFGRIFVSSRQEINKTLQQLRDKYSSVEFIPLDMDLVFQQAKKSHLNAMIDFRRWFNTHQLKSLRWMWWLTKPSFRHSFYDRVFNLYLCHELQKILKNQYSELNFCCYLYSDNRLASLVHWSIDTEVIAAPRKYLAQLWSVLIDIFSASISCLTQLSKRAAAKKEITTKKSDTDVCVISSYLPVCWEKRDGLVRDRYYADLPGFLKQSGLIVRHVISPGKRCSLLSKRQDLPTIDWDFAGTCRAAILTWVYFCMTAFVVLRNSKRLKQNWNLKLLAAYLLTNSKVFSTNLATYFAYKRFFARYHPRVILFYDEVYFSGRALKMALNAMPSSKRPIAVGMQHGVVSENQLAYYTDVGDGTMPFPSCDYFFVHNQLAKKCYKRFYMDNDCDPIKVIGLHRINTGNGSIESKYDAMPAEIDQNKPIISLIGGIPTDLHEIWQALVELMRDTPLQLIAKAHPSHPFPDDWLEGLDRTKGCHIWYSDNFDLDEVILKSDYVITTISTSLLNVVAHKKYPIIYNAHQRFDVSQMLSWFHRQTDAEVVQSADELKRVVKRLGGIKPLRPSNFIDEDIIIPPVVGENSMLEMYLNLKRIVYGQGSINRN